MTRIRSGARSCYCQEVLPVPHTKLATKGGGGEPGRTRGPLFTLAIKKGSSLWGFLSRRTGSVWTKEELVRHEGRAPGAKEVRDLAIRGFHPINAERGLDVREGAKGGSWPRGRGKKTLLLQRGLLDLRGGRREKMGLTRLGVHKAVWVASRRSKGARGQGGGKEKWPAFTAGTNTPS